MKLAVHRLEKEQWSEISEKCHKVCFNEDRPRECDRVDFALVCVDTEKNLMVEYATIKELDYATVYWQYGGSFPEYRGTIAAAKACKEFIEWCRTRYKFIKFSVENTNKPMLKLAAHSGFKIIGIRNFKGKVLLEHEFEFGEV